MVELRKRKEAPVQEPKPARKKSTSALKSKAKDAISAVIPSKQANSADSKTEDVPAQETNATTGAHNDAPTGTGKGIAAGTPPEVGKMIDFSNFGGEVETHDGVKVTLSDLVAGKKDGVVFAGASPTGTAPKGVVIFTYPKANTGGCTTQARLFKDSYTSLISTGLSIYGLSSDSPKSNASFAQKLQLQYPLLCDPSAVLLKPLGLHKAPKSAKRGVFVVSETGRVLALEQGGPAATVEVVKKIVGEMGGEEKKDEVAEKTKATLSKQESTKEEKEAAETAGEVADTAATLDGTPQPIAA